MTATPGLDGWLDRHESPTRYHGQHVDLRAALEMVVGRRIDWDHSTRVLTDDAQRAIDAAESQGEDRAEWAGYATPREMDEAGDKYHERDERGAMRFYPIPFGVSFLGTILILNFGDWLLFAVSAAALFAGLAVWTEQKVIRLEREVHRWRSRAMNDALAAEQWRKAFEEMDAAILGDLNGDQS